MGGRFNWFGVGGVVSGLALTAAPARAAAEDFADPPERPPTFEERRDEGRLSVEELRGALPGMVAADELPVVRFTPGLHVTFPYQFAGVGTGVELSPVRWVRLGVSYVLGLSLTREKALATHYAEGFFGLRVIGGSSESRVDIPLREPRAMSLKPVPALKAWVPSYHALFVEGGMITAFTGLEVCVNGCPVDQPRPPTEKRQLFMPAAGLRYVYYSDVRSVRAKVRSRKLIQVYAHAVAKPLGLPEAPRYFPNGDEAGPAGWGGRVGVELPPFGRCLASLFFGTGCASTDFSIGYAPYPRFVWLHIGIIFPLH